MPIPKEKLIELLETLPPGRLERLVRTSVIKRKGHPTYLNPDET